MEVAVLRLSMWRRTDSLRSALDAALLSRQATVDAKDVGGEQDFLMVEPVHPTDRAVV
jgi:hypothetical protein